MASKRHFGRTERWRSVLGAAALTSILTVSGTLGTSAASLAPLPSISMFAQTDGEAEPAPLTQADLARCLMGTWIHSHEEDTEEIAVYRPEGFAFPPSFPRTGFEFLPGGYLVLHSGGPADEPLVTPGRWEFVSERAVHVRVSAPGGPYLDETLRISSCSDGILEVAL